MNIKFAPLLVASGLLLAALPAHANSLVEGSAEDGKARALTCTACHGPEGNSMAPMWPNIAGQNAKYLVAQLKAFRGDTSDPDDKPLRSDPVMTTQAVTLSDQDINNLAVYFESLTGAAQAVADPSPLVLARGESLYRGGDPTEGIAACIACHGPTGRGNPAAGYPALNGQHATYTAKQLRDYASGARVSSDPTQQMRDISERLNAKDIEALASYVQGLR